MTGDDDCLVESDLGLFFDTAADTIPVEFLYQNSVFLILDDT